MSQDLQNFLGIASLIGLPTTVVDSKPPKSVKGKAIGSKTLNTRVKNVSGDSKLTDVVAGATHILAPLPVERSIDPEDFVKNRKRLGLGQQDVANLLGVSLSTIQKIEQGDVEQHRRDFYLRYNEFLNLAKFL